MQLRSLADEYCALIREAPKFETSQFILEVARLLSALIAAIYELGEPDNSTDTGRRDGVTPDEWNETFRTLQRVLGDEECEATVPEAEFVEDYLDMSLELPDALSALHKRIIDADLWRA